MDLSPLNDKWRQCGDCGKHYCTYIDEPDPGCPYCQKRMDELKITLKLMEKMGVAPIELVKALMKEKKP